MSQKPVRVVVVDDSTFMRGALVRMIEKDPRFKVVATANNGRDGVAAVKTHLPDVVTMDVEMPEMNGIEALQAIMASTKTPVIMVSTLTEAGANTTLRAMELGAVDFLPKALTDRERNIFKSGEDIHDKLLAAAGVANGRLERVTALEPAAISLPSESLRVNRVAAKVVIVGSSTGGPRALQAVLQKLPANLPVPVLVAQHMPAPFTLALAKRLDETCAVSVVEAQTGIMPEAGRVYVAPGGVHLRVTHSGLRVDEDRGEALYRPSVDVLAQSAYATYGKQVLGVMLTGMGNDGSREFAKLKLAGAHLIAQDQATSVVYGMPRAALEAGGASEVLALDKIGPRIRALLGV